VANRALSAGELADVIEIEVLAADRPVRSLEDLRRTLESRAVNHRNFALAMAQMGWRRNVLGDAYPFELSDVAIRLREHEVSRNAYPALLLMTPGNDPLPSAPSGDSAATLLLEKLTCTALERMLGAGARSTRFGWPSEVGRPQDFNSAIKWLAELMRIRVGAGFRPPRRKDGGVDVIAWRPFSDGRPGFPIVLAQCTVERDFVHKARDIDPRQWAAWLALESSILVALVLPGTMPSDEVWNEIGRNCVILERLRLVSLLAEEPRVADANLAAFVDLRLRALRDQGQLVAQA
jgi:hypothetical protein